ncbi:MAG: hypothetical protein JO100_00210 [Pseudonocardia sp.]|nr:hypothetical protein [Pseudonocardia sp.]
MGSLRHLIVIVPGIVGSVLTAPDGFSEWDLRAGDLVRAVLDPENLAIERELAPTRLVDDLTVLKPWLVVPGYGALTHHLRTQFGPELRVVDFRSDRAVPPDVDVLRVPYDFRRSIVEAADVLGRAVCAAVGDSGRKVIVVAHSMGGLVARYWIGPGGGWRHWRALITLGTPHRGAPRALDVLVNGAGLGRFRIPSVTRVLRGWPSVYELLPQYPAVLPETGGPIEIDALPPELLRTFGSPSAGVEFLKRAGEAAQVHRDIAAAWANIPSGKAPTVLPYFGRGHRTLNRAVIQSGRLRIDKEDPSWRPNAGWRGDGTVPALCAIPGELRTRPELAQAVPDKHGPMGTTEVVIERLVTLQGEDLPMRGTDRPPWPWIGWDVDDTIPADAQIVIGAQLHGGAGGPSEITGSAASLLLTGEGSRVALKMAFSEDGLAGDPAAAA